MKITKRQIKRIIREELLRELDEPASAEDKGGEDLEAKGKIVKGLAMMGIDEMQLKDLPSDTAQLKAFMSMVTRAVETAVSGDAKAAAKKVATGTASFD